MRKRLTAVFLQYTTKYYLHENFANDYIIIISKHSAENNCDPV
jgi:hypothetical protein